MIVDAQQRMVQPASPLVPVSREKPEKRQDVRRSSELSRRRPGVLDRKADDRIPVFRPQMLVSSAMRMARAPVGVLRRIRARGRVWNLDLKRTWHGVSVPECMRIVKAGHAYRVSRPPNHKDTPMKKSRFQERIRRWRADEESIGTNPCNHLIFRMRRKLLEKKIFRISSADRLL